MRHAAEHAQARPVRRALNNPQAFIAGTQLGITMASLGLGWVGEPTLAHILEPILGRVPHAPIYTHTIAIVLTFTIITYLHVILGELVPKTLA